MDFGCALIAMKEGLKVRRAIWEEGFSIKLLYYNEYQEGWFIYFKDKQIRKLNLLSHDIIAEDWEVLLE